MRAGFALLAAVLAGCAAAPPGEGGWKAGTGRAAITPAEPVMMYGYGARNKPSEGVAAELWARALALEDASGARAVVVTADIGEFDSAQSARLKDEIRRVHGLGEDRVLLVGSHTHSGPQLDEKTSYPAFFRERVLRAVADALGGLRPATLYFGRGEVRFGANRRVKRPDGTWWFGHNPEGPSDPDLPLMKVESEGALRALLFTYACHCTSVRNRYEGFYLIHPDWARCAEFLERERPGAQAMFVTGCGADIDPQPLGGIDVAERHARTMADAIGKAADSVAFRPVEGPLRTRHRRVRLPVEKPSREAYAAQVETARGPDQDFARKMLREIDAGTARSWADVPVAVWRFGGGLALVAFGGETCVDYALRLKREVGAEGLWVAGYSNEVGFYVPSDRVLAEGGYEAGWNPKVGRGAAAWQMAWAGFPAPFAPGIEDRMIGAAREMLRE